MNELDQLYRDAVASGNMDLAQKVLARKQLEVEESIPSPADMEGLTYRPFGMDTGIEMDPMIGQFMAGAGKRMQDVGSLGFRDNSLDAPLMEKPAAIAGSITGDMAALYSAARGMQAAPRLAAGGNALLKPQGILPAVTAGGLWGAATEPGSVKERLAAGAYAGLGGGMAPAIASMFSGFKSLIEPATRKGREKIAGEVLRRFGGDEIVNAGDDVIVPGSRPTTGEVMAQADNSGIPRLQEGLRLQDPEGFGNAMSLRQADQRMARQAQLGGIAQDQVAIDAATEARRAATTNLYSQADDYVIGMSDDLSSLLNRPAIKSAANIAKENVANSGKVLDLSDDGSVTGEFLHEIMIVLKEQAKGGANLTSKEKGQLRGIKSAKKAFDEYLVDTIPEYKQADIVFREMSKPINQMEAGQQFLEKSTPGLANYGATSRETAATLANVVDKAKNKGMKLESGGRGKLSELMSGEAIDKIDDVLKDLGRKGKAEDLMRGVGSNTAGNLSMDRLLNNVVKGAGLPSNLADSPILHTLVAPLKYVYNLSDDAIREILGDAMLDPRKAADLARMTKPLAEINVPIGNYGYGAPMGTSIFGGTN